MIFSKDIYIEQADSTGQPVHFIQDYDQSWDIDREIYFEQQPMSVSDLWLL